jgi:hypothetical protein
MMTDARRRKKERLDVKDDRDQDMRNNEQDDRDRNVQNRIGEIGAPGILETLKPSPCAVEFLPHLLEFKDRVLNLQHHRTNDPKVSRAMLAV